MTNSTNNNVLTQLTNEVIRLGADLLDVKFKSNESLIVLAKFRGEYVSWGFTLDCGGLYHGHYYGTSDYAEAHNSYIAR